MSPPEGGWPAHWPPDAIAFIESRLAKLEAENAALRQELEELRRAGQRQAGPFRRRKTAKNPKRPGRRPGPDHGSTANRPPPDQPDETVHVKRPGCCPDCGGSIEWEGMASQFQTDIPPVRPRTVEFRVPIGHCCRCKRRVQPRDPRQTSDALGAAGVQIGPNALGLGVYMNKLLGVPFAKVALFFREVFALRMASSTLVRATTRGAKESAPAYEGTALAVRESSVVHMDETGWRIRGTSWWLWVFVAEDATLFLIGSRGSEVPLAVLGEGWTGRMVHDGLGVYDVETFGQAIHQTCNSHLLHRAGQLAESVPNRAKQYPKEIKAILQAGLDLRDRREAGTISEHGVKVRQGQLKVRLDRALDRRVSNPDTARFQRHIEKHRDQIFTYLEQPGVEATNNRAERAIRPAVIARKRGGCSRSHLGAWSHAVWISLGATAIQRGASALQLFAEVFRRIYTGPSG